MKLIEKILTKDNVCEALNRVVANKGAAGIDGMKVEDLRDYMNANWESIRQSVIERSYKPSPVRRVEIPKPNGGVRKLGIPTVVDRTLQQSIVQILTPIFEAEFQENSYGFCPSRSCEHAVLKLLEYLNDGAEWIVDIDLEKFFDNVPQDKLMSYVGRIIRDPDTESLIRKYLKSGVMENGMYEATELGTPQDGNLSLLLSNVMLNELDKELVRRGLRYVRYADDCVIAVSSEASAKRVMHSIIKWIERVLGLKVNATKTHVCRPSKLKYLGFGFYKSPQTKQWTVRPHEISMQKFQRKLKKLCKRSWSISAGGLPRACGISHTSFIVYLPNLRIKVTVAFRNFTVFCQLVRLIRLRIRFLFVRPRFRYCSFSPKRHHSKLASRFGVHRQLYPTWTFTTDV